MYEKVLVLVPNYTLSLQHKTGLRVYKTLKVWTLNINDKP